MATRLPLSHAGTAAGAHGTAHMSVPLPLGMDDRDPSRWTFATSRVLPDGWDGCTYTPPAVAPRARVLVLFEYGVEVHRCVITGADARGMRGRIPKVAARVLAGLVHPCGLVCGGRAGFSVPSPFRRDAARNPNTPPAAGPLSAPAHARN